MDLEKFFLEGVKVLVFSSKFLGKIHLFFVFTVLFSLLQPNSNIMYNGSIIRTGLRIFSLIKYIKNNTITVYG